MAITQPARLRLFRNQLTILLKETGAEISRSTENLAYLILEHPQITITQKLIADA